MKRPQHLQGGATLIEILITLIILMFGLLGLVGVSSRSHMAELESLQRTRALELVQDMASRINANRKAAACYSDGAVGLQLGTDASTVPDCPADVVATNPQKTQAKNDLDAWDKLLKGTDMRNDTQNVGALINAVGCVMQTAEDTDTVYLIAVAWQGLVKTAAPTLSDGSAFPCGSAMTFGASTQHRVVTTKVHIGNLSGGVAP